MSWRDEAVATKGDLASIIDICTDQTVVEVTRLTLTNQSQMPEAKIDEFVQSLQIYGQNVHTRVIVFDDSSSDYVASVANEMHTYIMLIVLDMTPSEVLAVRDIANTERTVLETPRTLCERVVRYETLPNTVVHASCCYLGVQEHIQSRTYTWSVRC